MGIVYYLARDDNYSLFEIGKMYDWREAFAPFIGRVLTSDDTPTLASLLRAHCAEWGRESLLEGTYLDEVAAEVVQWAEGRPFVFIGEHDARIDDWPDSPFWFGEDMRDLRVTGSRYREDWEARDRRQVEMVQRVDHDPGDEDRTS